MKVRDVLASVEKMKTDRLKPEHVSLVEDQLIRSQLKGEAQVSIGSGVLGALLGYYDREQARLKAVDEEVEKRMKKADEKMARRVKMPEPMPQKMQIKSEDQL